MQTEDEVLAHVARRLPGSRPSRATRLTGGHLNYVWRVDAEPESLIVKWAPPFVATLPDVPLDPERILFEARSLRMLGPGGLLSAICSDAIRAPACVDFDSEAKVLVMEDLGTVPDLGDCLRRGSFESGWGELVGEFIGKLHARTAVDTAIAEDFNNVAVQRTRLSVQYRAVGPLLSKAGLDASSEAARRAAELGERLLQPGRCLAMGDLWPASILVDDGRLRLIDWELAHFGRPAQDVGHLLAHFWMHAQCSRDAPVARRIEALGSDFREHYLRAAEPAARQLLDAQFTIDCAVHMGAEIVMRTSGPFRRGSLYESFAPESSRVRAALDYAVTCMVTGSVPL